MVLKRRTNEILFLKFINKSYIKKNKRKDFSYHKVYLMVTKFYDNNMISHRKQD